MELRAVGLLSPGDMGHVVGQVIISKGMPVLTCLKGRSERTVNLAKKAGIKSLPSYEKLVRETDMILSIMVPGEAVNAARTVAQALRDTKQKIVYVDCNAISPATSRNIEEIIRGTGSRYVDASIVGPPPRREGVTKFYASGPHAEEFEALTNYGLDVRKIGSDNGLGKGIKMAYGALTKGLTAISTQLLIAAWEMGVYHDLVCLFEETQAEQYKRMKRAVPSMPHRSRRWVSEMEEISRTFEALGMTPKIYQGAADIYRMVGDTSLADKTAETMDRERTLQQVIEKICNESIAS